MRGWPSNCLFWALWQWITRGGYVAVRKSHWGWFPHFIWSVDLKTFYGYVPLKPKRRLLPPPLFRGHVVEEVMRPASGRRDS